VEFDGGEGGVRGWVEGIYVYSRYVRTRAISKLHAVLCKVQTYSA
jgi:hypothetical protein